MSTPKTKNSPPAKDNRPTITRAEAEMRKATAGLQAAAAVEENDPRLVEALLYGALGQPYQLNDRKFLPMTAGMLFTEEALGRLIDGAGIKLGTWETIALRGLLHAEAEWVYARLTEGGKLDELLDAARSRFFAWPVEDIQRLAAWLGADQVRFSDPMQAKALVATLGQKTTPPTEIPSKKSKATGAG